MNNVKVFFRTFVITFFILVCPLMLACGCIVADNNSRMIGFNDDQPAVESYVDESGLQIVVFGNRYTVPRQVLSTADTVFGYAWTAVPPPLRVCVEVLCSLPGLLKDIISLIFA